MGGSVARQYQKQTCLKKNSFDLYLLKYNHRKNLKFLGFSQTSLKNF